MKRGRPEEHFSVAFTIPRLGKLLLEHVRLVDIEIDLDDRVPEEIAPRDYERMALQVIEQCGPGVFEPPNYERPVPRQGDPDKAPPAVRCFYLAKALFEACSYEREGALYGILVEAAALVKEGDDYGKRFCERLASLKTVLATVVTGPRPNRNLELFVAGLERALAGNQSVPESSEAAPWYAVVDSEEEAFADRRDTIARLLAETKINHGVLAEVFYDDFAANPSRVEGRFNRRVLEAWKRVRKEQAP
jgi:hypothetical protein